jgi:hypothetical protein
VTTFWGQGKAGSQAISQVFKEFGRKIHPLDFKKSLNFISGPSVPGDAEILDNNQTERTQVTMATRH